jgi:hypothetical protein
VSATCNSRHRLHHEPGKREQGNRLARPSRNEYSKLTLAANASRPPYALSQRLRREPRLQTVHKEWGKVSKAATDPPSRLPSNRPRLPRLLASPGTSGKSEPRVFASTVRSSESSLTFSRSFSHVRSHGILCLDLPRFALRSVM